MQAEDCRMKIRQKMVPLKKPLKLERVLLFQKKAEIAREQEVQSNPPLLPEQKIWQFFLTHPRAFDSCFQFEVKPLPFSCKPQPPPSPPPSLPGLTLIGALYQERIDTDWH